MTIQKEYVKARRKWARPGPAVDEHKLFLEALRRCRKKLPGKTEIDLADRKSFYDWKTTPGGKQTEWELNWAGLRTASKIARLIEREGPLSRREICRRARIPKAKLTSLEQLIESANLSIDKDGKIFLLRKP